MHYEESLHKYLSYALEKMYVLRTYVHTGFVSWLRGGSKEKLCVYSHVAQVSDTAQVTRQVSLLGLIAREQGRKLVNTFLLHIMLY